MQTAHPSQRITMLEGGRYRLQIALLQVKGAIFINTSSFGKYSQVCHKAFFGGVILMSVDNDTQIPGSNGCNHQ
jgi:hypothetical protein